MLRTVALSLLLTLTASPVAGLLCQALCVTPVAAVPSCHRETASTTDGITGVHDCHRASLLAAALLPEPARATSHADALAPAAMASRAAPAATTGSSRADGADTGPPDVRRPVALVLRI